jgi:Tol biopolymer transport system component
MVDTETGMRLKITDGAAGAFNPTWSDSGRIYFVSARTGVENIWSLSTDLESYPGGRQAGESPKLSQAAVNTPIETE